jgi:hypothetical protein
MQDIHDLIGHKCCLLLISAFNFFIVHQVIELADIRVGMNVTTLLLPPAGRLSARQ